MVLTRQPRIQRAPNRTHRHVDDPATIPDYDNAATATATALMEYEDNAGFSYRSILGCVIYVYVVARIDIGFAVTLLARFSDHPVKIHFDSLRRLARYLRMTKDWGLIFGVLLRSIPSQLETSSSWCPTLVARLPSAAIAHLLAGYVDAAHATDLSTRRSITGLAFMLCGGPIAYKSKVQSTVSTSSTEAEFIAAVKPPRSPSTCGPSSMSWITNNPGRRSCMRTIKLRF
ncbi:gag-polypeptide of LTR copia-type [Fragilaria crotonensis]|nr:gag-polypeptide of LTR copia-type [Fragilaria crotonensis]